MKVRLLFLWASPFLFPGCATILHGTHQNVTILSEPPGALATIQPGDLDVRTPADVDLERKNDYRISFELDGYESVTVRLRQEESGAHAANALLGGPIGASIDEENGAAYNLVPDPLKAVLTPAEGTESEAAVPGDSDEADSNDGLVKVVFINTNGPGYPNPVRVEVDGREVAKLKRKEYIETELEVGKHRLMVEHRDLFLFSDEYEIEVDSSPVYIDVYSRLTSTDYRISDLPPHDLESNFTAR